LEEHCKRCRICETALEEARKRQTALQSVPPVEASENLIQSTLAALDRQAERDQKHRQTWRKMLWSAGSAVAAAVLLLVGMHIYYANLRPSPYDLTVLGQNRLMADSNASLRIQLRDRSRSTPLTQVPVSVQLKKPAGEEFVTLVDFQTD